MIFKAIPCELMEPKRKAEVLEIDHRSDFYSKNFLSLGNLRARYIPQTI